MAESISSSRIAPGFVRCSAGLEIAVALRKLYPSQWKVDGYIRLLVNNDTLERLKRGEQAGEIVRSWSDGLEEFRKARARALLYQ